MNVDYAGIAASFQDVRDYVVFTVEPPWRSCESLLRNKPKHVTHVSEVDLETLDGYVETVPRSQNVAGIGGGRAIDAAKYVAMKTASKFISVPTILAADAYVTPKAGVRIEGNVTYLGDKFPDKIVIDYAVIRGAPKRLNRAGVGDIYSAKISLAEWKLARDLRGEEYDGEVAGGAERVLAQLKRDTRDILDVTEKGVRSLVEMHIVLNELQFPYVQRGKFWPQEGSEHLFFYTLEKLTGKTFIHGEVIGAGAVVATYLQGGDTAATIADLDSFGVEFRASRLGITFGEFERTLRKMRATGEEIGARYVSVEKWTPTDQQVREMWGLVSDPQEQKKIDQ
jgi:glycerol dehydrogenase-like iron-containing ADH family enzyme